MKLCEITMFILVILLTLSVGWNVFNMKEPKTMEPEIVTVSDTVTKIDTIYIKVKEKHVAENPVPVQVDSVSNIKTYRDTIHHEYGSIWREEIVFGELLRKNIEFDLRLPEVTKTVFVNTVTKQYVNRPLFFVTTGMQTDFRGVYSPTIGGQYVFRNQKFSLSYNYQLNSGQHNFVLGYGVF
jgi:hypothetical protein